MLLAAKAYRRRWFIRRWYYLSDTQNLVAQRCIPFREYRKSRLCHAREILKGVLPFLLWRSGKAFRFGRTVVSRLELRRYLPNSFIDKLAAKMRPEQVKSWPRRIGPIRSFQFDSDFFNVTCHEIVPDRQPIRYVDSTPLAYCRLTSLFETVPATMPWLESFREGETMVDIGANIGMHAIYAAVFTGCRVFAFEPESLNYAELNKNIFVNHLNDRVSAFCMALTNEVKIGFLDLDTSRISQPQLDCSEHPSVADPNGQVPRQRLRQACVTSTLDTLVEAGVVPAPNHIMIEVSDANYEVLAGCRRTLENSALQSVLFEIDFRSVHSESILNMMTGLGWKYSMDQLRINPNFILPVEFIHTLRREKSDRMHYIFFRDDRYMRLFRDFLIDYHPPRPFPSKKVAMLIQKGRLS